MAMWQYNVAWDAMLLDKKSRFVVIFFRVAGGRDSVNITFNMAHSQVVYADGDVHSWATWKEINRRFDGERQTVLHHWLKSRCYFFSFELVLKQQY